MRPWEALLAKSKRIPMPPLNEYTADGIRHLESNLA